MKRIVAIILISMVSLSCLAQAKLTILTKKERVSDFPTKTMKVVLPEDAFVGEVLRESVKNVWSISSYEFCDGEEFGRLRENEEYYFMILYKGEGKDYDGISYLTVVKGGAKSLEEMDELVTMPLCPADEPTGREGVFMPAILDVMQRYIENSLIDGFKSLGTMVEKFPEAGNIDLVFDETDLSEGISGKMREQKLSGAIRTSEEIAELFLNGTAGTAVGYTISPAVTDENSVCYKMLFDARSHSLYYFKKHKISPSKGKGFLKGDISKFIAED